MSANIKRLVVLYRLDPRPSSKMIRPLTPVFLLFLLCHFTSQSFVNASSQLPADSSRNNLEPLSHQQSKASPASANLKRGSTSADIDGGLTSSSSAVGTHSARFVTSNGTLITAQRGSTASLPCEVVSLGDGVVTWFRRKDFHLLTVGHAVYSSDERFHVQGPMRSTQTQDWALQIRFAQERDSGLYECQLSTHPPSSLFVELVVVEAHAEIDGGPEKYVKSGSTLKLTCHLRQSSVTPDFVFWYQDERMINYEGAAGVKVISDAASSTLIIERAQSVHSGNYSCVPYNVNPSSVIVHILNGEKPAAMQHSSAALHWYSVSVIFIVECVFLKLNGVAGSLQEWL
ncbi:zwei Ig domain protein zig-8 [Daphnia magna]|uniref:Putative Defective proboscis extension response n=1 Tax=Daphnia magna TaxID=35525 RepID=A0A0P5YBU9_9CRUS|nr:zwei Ig domain protein zig-8 [Daphnia magna]XP_045034716.1 zwei Ig domain protein zig-8 [Daphnia magna]KZS19618.1 putative Hemicentin-2 [Daphnia magna]